MKVFNKRDVLITDILISFIVICIAVILCVQKYISPTQMFLGVVGFSCVLGFLSLLLFCKKKIFTWLKEEWSLRLSLWFKCISILHKSYDERMIETIFAYFVHYYNKNISEISQERKFPEEEFPEGSYDLIKVYMYITQFRHSNRSLLSKIDFVKDRPTLYRVSFKHLKFKINKNYQLEIIGDNENDCISFLQYKSFETKLEVALYDLDSQIASWLIRNRNHFGF